MVQGRAKSAQVVPGIEPGFPESESDVITATLYNLIVVETRRKKVSIDYFVRSSTEDDPSDRDHQR